MNNVIMAIKMVVLIANYRLVGIVLVIQDQFLYVFRNVEMELKQKTNNVTMETIQDALTA